MLPHTDARHAATQPIVFYVGRRAGFAYDAANGDIVPPSDDDAVDIEKIAKAFGERLSSTDLKSLAATLSKMANDVPRTASSGAMDAKLRDFGDRFPSTRRMRFVF